MLRTAWLLPLKGFSTLGLRPACYRASWQLPGRDSHPQATTSLQRITIYILDLHLLGERYGQDKAENSPPERRNTCPLGGFGETLRASNGG